MFSFSTDDIAPEHRFEQWREVRGKSLFGVTIDIPAERRRLFHGSFRAHMVGGAVASEMQASAYLVSRTGRDIARIAGDSLCLSLQVKGGGWLDTGRGGIDTVRPGDMAICHSDLPYAGGPDSDRDFHFLMLKIPLTDEITLGHRADDLFAAKPMESMRFMRPFRALFDALLAPGIRLVDPAADVTHAARLALAARGRLRLSQPEVRAAVRAGLYYGALAIMARDKLQPELAPAAVAAELGISLRQLHILFERAGRSFARTLSALRIEAAHRLLVDMPSLSVTHIAFACGFDSLATFYRVFGSTYGTTPGNIRPS